MLRKIVTALILIPLAVIIIAFAVANRQIVTVSFDPFSSSEPAAALTLPLFALIILLLIFGVLVGGVAAWLRQSKWRSTARRLERQVQALRKKVDALEGPASGPAVVPGGGDAAPRLQLRPPLP
ncbi:MAG TPA: LapA family protein [Xanthobacteraceae bacterium]|nr:LapA family protein [Xanthobacteraceae bacterium]